MRRLCHGAAEGAGKLPAAIQPDHVRVHVGFALAATHWAVRSRVHHLRQRMGSALAAPRDTHGT